MGFNRSQRRQLERQLNKKQNFEAIRERVKNQARDQIIDELEDTRVEILMNCVVIALHNEFGFGQARCMRVLNAIDGLMVMADNDELTRDRLREMAEQAAGVIVKY